MQKNTLLALAAIFGLVGYIGYDSSSSQIAIATGEQKVFVHGKDLLDAIDGAEYTDNTPVAANSQLSTITIENWDDVKTLDKTTITTQATLSGYEEIIP